MTNASYLRPPWGARVIGNRMAKIFARSVLSTLAVQGRTSGRWRSVPVAVLDHDGHRYLIAPRGNTEWSRNLRVAGSGRLTRKGRPEAFDAVEVPVAERPPLIEAYIAEFGRFPTVADTFRQLPDPADHPTFRIVASPTGTSDAGHGA
jgi:deazaflavin-dependent oxidoreductase (nitroreductase family)